MCVRKRHNHIWITSFLHNGTSLVAIQNRKSNGQHKQTNQFARYILLFTSEKKMHSFNVVCALVISWNYVLYLFSLHKDFLFRLIEIASAKMREKCASTLHFSVEINWSFRKVLIFLSTILSLWTSLEPLTNSDLCGHRISLRLFALFFSPFFAMPLFLTHLLL